MRIAELERLAGRGCRGAAGKAPMLAVMVLLLAACATAFPAAASSESCLQPESDRPRIGLVLGGGGARGSAHIGVIRVLEELGVPVDCIAGTSIGSLVGALYATGMTADELEAVMLGIDWDDLFVDDTEREDQPFRRKRDDDLALFGPKLGIERGAALIKAGAISGQKVSFLFESLVKQRVQTEDFDALPIPFRAVAADISDGSAVVLGEGDLALAMRSSMSVPGVFDPVRLEEKLLVDGGIVDNLPVDVVREMGADVVIAVNVGSGLTGREDLKTALDIVAQLTNILIESNSRAQVESLRADDVLITPPLGDEVSSADFSKAARGIEIGYAAADAARQSLAVLSIAEADYRAHRAGVNARVTHNPTIDFVRIDNASRFDDRVLERRLSVATGEPLDVPALDADVREIYALGFLDLVRYEVVEEQGRTGIVVHAGQDPRGTQLLEWGLDYYGDGDSSSVNLRAGYLHTAVDGYGSELRVVAQVGESPGLFGYLYKYLHPELQFFLEPSLFAEKRELLSYDEDGNALQSNEVTQYGGAIAFGREFGKLAAIKAGVRSFGGDVDVGIGPPDTADYDFDGGEYFVHAIYDRLNDRYFPGRGAYASVRYIGSSEGLGADVEYEQLQADLVAARTFGRHSVQGGAHYSETLDDVAPIYAQFRAGGFTRLSGYHENELVGQNFSMAFAGYRYRFAGAGLLPAYVGGTLEYGDVAEDAGDLFDDAELNGSLYLGYRSPIGPLYLGVGMAEGGRGNYFLRVGNVFGQSSIGR